MSPFQVLLAKHGRRRRFHLYPRAAAWSVSCSPSPPWPGYAHRLRRSETEP